MKIVLIRFIKLGHPRMLLDTVREGVALILTLMAIFWAVVPSDAITGIMNSRSL